jgi:organic hydroperoxide reductase OsmC/OhrA
MEAVMANTREHRYTVSLTWTGNLGSGTSGYRDYSRDYEISAEGKPVIHGSADPAFRGDRSRWNPEELLVASLSQELRREQRHMLVGGAIDLHESRFARDPLSAPRTGAAFLVAA